MAKQKKSSAISALERLALGKVNDAVSLTICGDLSADELRRLDLSCVSEIKQIKGGGFEIKFIDRLEALRLLLEHQNREEKSNGAGQFYEALARSAKSIGLPPSGDDSDAF